MMDRIDKLFLTLWVLVFSAGFVKSFDYNMTLVTKEKVFSHNVIGVTSALLNSVNNKSQLAAVIGHELAHIQLKHTINNKHDIAMEYDSDLMSVFYMKKAGYNICEAKLFWEKNSFRHLALRAGSHPNSQTRAFYMTFPECKGYISKKEPLTQFDAMEVFQNMNKHVAGIDRHKTIFTVFYSTDINAYAQTIMKENK